MQRIGQVSAIYTYPIKSLAAVLLDCVDVEAHGLPGDRSSALFVRSGHAREGKSYRGKEHDRLHLTTDIDDALTLASERGVTVDVRDDEPHYFDAAPISILIDRWLDDLSAHVEYAVEPLRFRPNFVVVADPEFALDESALTGATLHLGGARLIVRGGIGRCVTPTYDLQDGTSDPRILRYIAQERANLMGIYCDVAQPGTIRVGDILSSS
jgi:hypothetical protein